MANAEVERKRFSTEKVRSFKRKLFLALPMFSLVVVIGVFWWLKLTGITVAGGAFCGMDEHTHTEGCYESTLICSYTEGEEVCTIEHTHTEECEKVIHSHTDECYSSALICREKEHIHDMTCFSDITADVESKEDWESTLPPLSDSLSPATKTVEIARSQLGYSESTLNFTVDESLVRHGYTRYGEWYGNPYGEWSAMFCGFCLSYAGIDSVPLNSGAEAMRIEWENEGIYYPRGEYSPIMGDIVFLDKNEDAKADSVAVVQGCDDKNIYVIEGDYENQVAELSYSTLDSAVIGYGTPVPGNNLLYAASPLALGDSLGRTVDYSQSMLDSGNSFILYTVGSDGGYSAIGGSSEAVAIEIDAEGNITADVSDPQSIYWTFTYQGDYQYSDNNYGSERAYYIQNGQTGAYVHPCGDPTAVISGRWESGIFETGEGFRIRGARQNYYATLSGDSFVNTSNANNSSTFYLGMVPQSTVVWLDGTCGGLMSLAGSLNRSYTLGESSEITLPEQWQSPSKYSYKLQGWLDVKSGEYYLPGETVYVSESTVFYADWIAETYDIGVFNSSACNTVSTNDFITTHLFDYNVLFNLLSESVTVSANASGHNEVWTMVQEGAVPYNGQETLDFIFTDYDKGGDISYPNNRASNNVSGDVYSGLYNDRLGEVLFSTENAFDPETGEGVIGKYYVGNGDYLFQLGTDPQSENYGYYYYDSRQNAASYNQSEGRFYVYDYLERTADSAKDGGEGGYSDFLPLNSPYANTNGKYTTSYTYEGDYGQYGSVNHFQYDAKYDSNNNSPDNVATNYMFGMSMDMKFHLPNVPGSVDENGEYGNRDVFGKEMHFKFSGDDDVWVFVDGELVLDLGGIHGVESGDVNFSTGTVTVNGVQTGTLSHIEPGDHILTVYYLERGSSQSNCAIYFNLAPRFSLTIQKEDVLTREVLNGAQFSVYTDSDCTVPAVLWESEEVYESGEEPINTFTVINGKAEMWGFSSGTTYYIKETAPPDVIDYSCSYGIICLELDKTGIASYSVEIIGERDSKGNLIDPSNGFTVHGFKIDEETQEAFIVVTNAQDWVTETTTVQATKIWDDTEDHTYDSVTVYLTVTDSDGTVRRIREIQLSEENQWTYIWTSLPKYQRDGITEVIYGVEEAYKTGYSPTIESVEEIVIEESHWAEAYTFEGGSEYILKTSYGCLSTVSATSSNLMWVDEETAKTSPLALWTATVSGSNVRLTNGEGQILTFNYSSYSSGRYFYAPSESTGYQSLVPVNTTAGISFYALRGSRSYYMGSLNSSGRGSTTTQSGSALTFVPMTKVTETTVHEVQDYAFTVTNTPLAEETSLTVYKEWDTGMASSTDYERAQVTVHLYANGKETGRSVTLSLKNAWTDTFLGLPYRDTEGNIILYTVVETWETEDWTPEYSEVRTVTGGEVPTYEVTVTNVYKWGHGYELPATGGYGALPYVIVGFVISISSVVILATVARRKKERSDK